MSSGSSGPAPIVPLILRETDSWIILDKPAGWHTVSSQRTVNQQERAAPAPLAPDVEAWLRDSFDWARGLDEAGLVHRLDCGTSGCLLVAKHAAERDRLREQLQRDDPGTGGVRKIYLAIVTPGLPARGEFRLYFTSRHRGSRKVTVRDSGEPRHEGRCRWRAIPPPFEGGGQGVGHVPELPAPYRSPHPLPEMAGEMERGDLIEIELIGPGRRHQIRAGFAHLGHPLLGDTLYRGTRLLGTKGVGGERAGGESDRAQTRFFLHAWKLTIHGVETVAPVPANWPAVALND